MKIKVTSIILLFFVFNISLAQTKLNDLMVEIEKHNPTLNTLRKQTDAIRMQNKTGLTPDNPEVEFNHLWGKPNELGVRNDISVSQSFDFPTTYIFRQQIAKNKNLQLQFEFEKQKVKIIHEARLIGIQLIYLNKYIQALQVRLDRAEQLKKATETLFQSEQISLPEYNKTQLHCSKVKLELSLAMGEKDEVLEELRALNGGIPVIDAISEYNQNPLPISFESWYEQTIQLNPVIKWINFEIKLTEKEVKLTKAMKMPRLNAGYMSEEIVGEKFQGVSFGISIPLWENNNQVKHAKLQTVAVQSKKEEIEISLYSQQRLLFNKASYLQQSFEEYQKDYMTYHNKQLLQKAYELGELSLIEYLTELNYYNESENQLLMLEKEQNIAIETLYRFE